MEKKKWQTGSNMEKKKWQTGQKIFREVSNSVENDLVQIIDLKKEVFALSGFVTSSTSLSQYCLSGNFPSSS
nr:hypothetical protein CFP56_42035 [Quercus suber]